MDFKIDERNVRELNPMMLNTQADEAQRAMLASTESLLLKKLGWRVLWHLQNIRLSEVTIIRLPIVRDHCCFPYRH